MLEIIYLPTYTYFYFCIYCLAASGGLGFQYIYLVRNSLSLGALIQDREKKIFLFSYQKELRDMVICSYTPKVCVRDGILIWIS